MKKTTRILVVDDEPAILRVYSELLRTEGYEVWTAATGRECLEVTSQRHPDLVLLDVMLPDLSGIEVCRQLKADAALSDAGVVLFSGIATGTARKVDGLAAGADDYMVKSVDPEEFLARIRMIARLHETTAALRASEQHYRRLVELLPDGVALLDLQGRLLEVNPRGAAMLGYADASDLRQRSAYDLTPPEDHERIRADIAAALGGGILRKAEYQVLRRGGHRFPAELSAALSTDTNGQPTGFVLVFRDISERQRFEEALTHSVEALRTNMQFLETLINAVPFQIFYRDLSGRYLGCNRAFARCLGLAEGQIRGQTVDEAGPRDLAEQFHQAEWELLARPGQRTSEVSMVCADGKRREVILSQATFLNAQGKVAGLVGALVDVTERKRTEAQVRLLANAVQSTTELICITDPENQFTFANRAFLEAYGRSLGEILGRTPDLLASPRNPPGQGEQILQHTLEGGWRGELLNRRKNGTEFPVSLTTSPIRDDQGRVLGLVGVARDISERKQAEKERAALGRLGHRLSAASAPDEAAGIMLETASELFQWDAGYVALYSQTEDRVIPLLIYDLADGQRTLFPPESLPQTPTPLMRLVIKEGPRLVNEGAEAVPEVKLAQFGNPERRSVSRMYVPISAGGAILGLFSLQSYTAPPYSPADLKQLETLADHCGGALRRIEAIEALRRAEAKYRTIFENATDGIFQTTPKGQYLSANPALARMLGYASTEELLARVTNLARQVYVEPKRREEFKRLMAAHDSVQGFEFELYREDGSTIWVSANAHAERDTRGAIQYYEGTLQDITERRWAEHVLKIQRDFGVFLSSTGDLRVAVERLLQLALENEGVECGAVHLVDPWSGALDLVAQRGLSADFVKQGLHVVTGHAPARGNGPGRAGSRGRRGPLAELVRLLEREGLQVMETIPMQYNRRVVAALHVGSRLHREIPRGSRHVMEAIAAQAAGAIARIRAEESSRAHREMFEKTINGLEAAVLIIDAKTDAIVECNPAATHIFGYGREELLGHSPAFLHLDAGRRQQFLRHLEAIARNKQSVSEFEFEMRRKDGTTLPTEHSVAPLPDDAGQIQGWVDVIRNIRERKRAEEGLREVSRRIIEAQEAERLRVAHELHDGVNQIIASAKMRLRRVGDTLGGASPAAREILERCDRLLVQALEENRRIAHGLRPADLDALGLATACRRLCQDLQSRTHLAVKCSLTRHSERLPAAVQLNLFRIVQEAINNVERHAQARTVGLRISIQAGSIVLRLRDDGRGFSPKGPHAAKEKRPGIGLANMRERAASMGGTCEIVSAPGQGTTITVRVPLPKPN